LQGIAQTRLALRLLRASVLVIYTTHHHMIYTSS